MKTLVRYGTAGALSAGLALLFGGAESNAVFSARESFPPDLVFLLATSAAPPILLKTISGAVLGLASALAGEARLFNACLVLFNPLTLFALAGSAPGVLFFAAALLTARAFANLPGAKEPEPTISFGLILALAPFITNSMLAICFGLIGLGALVSPWGYERRRLAGFLTVTAAPLVLALISAAYLVWLFGPRASVALTGAPRLAPIDQGLLLAGAGLIGVTARFRSRILLAAGGVLGACLLYAARPDIAASALSHIAGTMNAP